MNNYRIHERHGIKVVTFEQGRFDAKFVNDIKEDMLVDILSQDSVIFNLTKVNFIDSSALGFMVSIFRHVDSRFSVCGCIPAVMAVLELTRLVKIFPVYDSVEIALFGGSNEE